MASLMIQHHVKDFAAWKRVFDSFIELRTSNGELSDQVFHDASDPNSVTVIQKWKSVGQAQKFSQSAELKAAMEKAGVEGQPKVSFLDEA